MVEKKPIYSPHPSIAYWQSMIVSLAARTGKSMPEWLAELKESGAATDADKRRFLKNKHKLGLSTIALIVEEAAGKSPDAYGDPEALVAQIFAGPKQALLGQYHEILAYGLSLGEDVRVCPCATIVPFYREHVFAQVKAPNRTTIHLGLALRDLPAEGILISTGGFEKKDRITHRLEITEQTPLGKNQKRWFRRAYELNAGQ